MKYKYIKTNSPSVKTENNTNTTDKVSEEKQQTITEDILDFVIDVNAQGDISGKREYHKNENQSATENIIQQENVSNEVEIPSSLSSNRKKNSSALLNKFKNTNLFSKKTKNKDIELENIDIDFTDNTILENNDSSSKNELLQENNFMEENSPVLETSSTELFEKSSNLQENENFDKNEKKSFLSKFKKDKTKTIIETIEINDLDVDDLNNEEIKSNITTEKNTKFIQKDKKSFFKLPNFKKKKTVMSNNEDNHLELSDDDIENGINLFNENDFTPDNFDVSISPEIDNMPINIETEKEIYPETFPVAETDIVDSITDLEIKNKEKKSLFGKFKKKKKLEDLSLEIEEIKNEIFDNDNSETKTDLIDNVILDTTNNNEPDNSADINILKSEENIGEKQDITLDIESNTINLPINEQESNLKEVSNNNLNTDLVITDDTTENNKEKKTLFSKLKKNKLDDLSLDIETVDNSFVPESDTLSDINIFEKEEIVENTTFNSESVDTEQESIVEDINNTFSTIDSFDSETDIVDSIVDNTVKNNKEKKSLFGKFKKKKLEDLSLEIEETKNEISDSDNSETKTDLIDNVILDTTNNEENNMNILQKEKLPINDDSFIKQSKDNMFDTDLSITESDLTDNAFYETSSKKEKKPLFGFFKKNKSRTLDELDELSSENEQKEILDLNSITNSEFSNNSNVQKENKKEKVNLFSINKPKESEKPQIELSYDRFEELGEDFVPEEEIAPNDNFEIENTSPKKKVNFALPAFLTSLSFGKKKKKSEQLFENDFDLQENQENITIETSQSFDNNFSELNTSEENSLFNTNTSQNNASSLFEDNSNLSDTSVQTPQLNNTISLSKKNLLIILLIIIMIVTFTTVLTTFIVSKLVSPSTEPTVVENTIDQEAIDKAVQEALNKMNYFNEINNTTSQLESSNVTNNKPLELPPQLGIDFETSNIEENKDKISTKMFNLGNLSFSYPMEWVENAAFNLKPTPENVSNIVMLGVDNDSLKHVNNMRITTETLLQAISAKEYVERTEEILKDNYTNLQLRNSKETTVSGREAPTRIYSYEQNGENYFQYQIYVADKTKIYIITFTSSARLFEDNYKIYNEILETIRI